MNTATTTVKHLYSLMLCLAVTLPTRGLQATTLVPSPFRDPGPLADLPMVPGTVLEKKYLDYYSGLEMKGMAWRGVSYRPLLVAEKNGKVIRIVKSMKDLDGLMRVRSKDDALQVLRLYTSPGYPQIFECPLAPIEVLSRKTISLSTVYGCAPLFHYMVDMPSHTGFRSAEGVWGLVDSPAVCRIANGYPKVLKTKNGFRIRRLMIKIFPKGVGGPFELVEDVSWTGGYKQVVELGFRSEELSKIEWKPCVIG